MQTHTQNSLSMCHQIQWTENRFSHDYETWWSSMMTNVCCSAKASCCQLAGLWYAMEKNISRNDNWCTQSWKKKGTKCLWLCPWMPRLQHVYESMHGKDKAGIRTGGREDEWMHADAGAGAEALEMKFPCPGKTPYFQIRWGFQLSWGWRPPPPAGPTGMLGWTSMSDLRMLLVGRHPHILSTPSQLGQAPRKKQTK